ncbi:retrotransposon protein, putative, ty1-copia subclass [Tanacetum coccineum]
MERWLLLPKTQTIRLSGQLSWRRNLLVRISQTGIAILGLFSDLQRTLEKYNAFDVMKELKTMFEEQAKQELFETVKAFHACKQEDGQSVSSYLLKMKSYLDTLECLGYAMPKELGVSLILNSLNKDYNQFVQNYSMYSIGKRLAELHAMLKLHEKGITKKTETPAVLAIHEGKIQKDKKKPQGAKGKDKGNNKLAYAPKTKISLPPKRENLEKDSIYHHCNGMRAAVEAIESFDLILPSGLIIVLDNCHYAPTVTRGVTLLDMVQSMMNLTTLLKSFWGYALETAARILNMVPTKEVDRTPYEIWHGKAPKLSYLKVWGCEALVKLDTPDKLDSRFIKCIFVGLEIIQEEDTQPSKNTSKEHDEVAPVEVKPQNVGVPICRSARIPQAPDRYGYYVDIEEYELGDFDEPPNYKVALADPESDKWLEAMNTEMQSMKDNQVWILIKLPLNGRTVRSKWIFKKKIDMDANVHTFKAHLVAKGYTQIYGVDYGETFSFVADITAIRILLAIAAFYDYEIWQMDVKTAFLNGHLSEDVYTVQPEWFVDRKHPNKICKLQCSIYRLKQASKRLNKRFDEEIKKIGFTQNPDEPCVYLKASGSNVAFLVLYVDDILLMGNSVAMLQEVKSRLCKCFSMKYLGEATYILGIKIIRDRSKRLIALSQNAYLEKILKKFRMGNFKKGYTLIMEKPDYTKSQGDKTPTEVQHMQRVPYASAIGSIMYAHKLDVKETKLHYNIFSRGRVRGVSCKLCSSNVDEDTASILWLQLQQNTVVLRLSVSHSNIMQPRTTFTDKAHPYSLKKKDSVRFSALTLTVRREVL